MVQNLKQPEYLRRAQQKEIENIITILKNNTLISKV